MGERVALRATAASLQSKAGEGPLVEVAPQPAAAPEDIAQLLEGMGIARRSASQGERPLKIVDFLSLTLSAEEKMILDGGVTLKINTKPKLCKVTPAMWVVGNTRIMKATMARPDFSAEQCLIYIVMIGEMACRFIWISVLFFDEEYRQRQAAMGFPWGTEAPHLSTVLLPDRHQGTEALHLSTVLLPDRQQGTELLPPPPPSPPVNSPAARQTAGDLGSPPVNSPAARQTAGGSRQH